MAQASASGTSAREINSDAEAQRRMSHVPAEAVELGPPGTRRAKAVPKLAFACLIGAALTTLVSLALLLAIRNKPVWPSDGVYGFMQPASWLSALLSLSGILLNMALADGLTVAWWRQAAQRHTTVADLHSAWAAGTSYLEAIRAWRKFKYISFATLAIALIPINGFLLQAAISTAVDNTFENVTIIIPMVPFLDLGYSTEIDAESNVIDSSGGPWPNVWQQVQNIVGSKNSQYAYIGTFEDVEQPFPFNYDITSIYKTRTYGAGFDVNCTSYSHSCDLTPTKDRPSTRGRIFSSEFGFDPNIPNTITLDVYWKNDSTCCFNVTGKRCTLRAATVEYPIQVEMNISSSSYLGPFYSLPFGTTRFNDTTVKILPVYEEEGRKNYTYAGIAQTLGEYYNSTIDITDQLGGENGSWIANGQLADSLRPNYLDPNPIYFCQVSFQDGLEYLAYLHSLDDPIIDPNTLIGSTGSNQADFAEIMLDRVRQSMFLASIYMGAEYYTGLNTNFGDSSNFSRVLPYNKSHYAQEIQSTRSQVVAVYHIRLYLWGISLAITWIVIGIILPTFWGYWTLPREASMSPVDIARAFHAPLLSDVDHELDTNALLEEVGGKSIHHDLRPSIDESKV